LNRFSLNQVDAKPITARIAQIIASTEAEGPGNRFAIWFQGCPLRCPGCCNPEMLSFQGGMERTVQSVCEEIRRAVELHSIEGITFLGGEPLSHASSAVPIAEYARNLGLSVMIFSGHILEEVHLLPDPNIPRLLVLADILVDGPFMRDLPDNTRRWIGSTNQRIHFLTDRYDANDPCWQESNTLEIRLRGKELTVNGFPSRSAVGIWKRPRSNHK